MQETDPWSKNEKLQLTKLWALHFVDKDKCYDITETLVISAASWQNQRNGMCAQRRLRSAWASTQSDQSLCRALNG